MKYFVILSLLVVSSVSDAQQKIIIVPDNPLRLRNLNLVYSNPAEKEILLKKIFTQIYAAGYLSARPDTIISSGSTDTLYISTGPVYHWLNLYPGNGDEGALRSSGYQGNRFTGTRISIRQLDRLLNAIPVYYENRGYPFALASLSNIIIGDSTITAELYVEKGPVIHIDSIIIHGETNISPSYIYNYIGIKPGSLYNHSQLVKVSDRLSEIPFLISTAPPEITYTLEGTRLILYLAKQRASNFDGILGVLPDDNVPGQILITGDLRLRLMNALGQGELIHLRMKKLQTQTQDFNAGFNYPFLFSTPMGADIQLSLYKRDTTFLNVGRNLAVQYSTGGNNSFRVFLNYKTTSVLSTHNFPQLREVPDYADVSTLLYGLGGIREKLDYRFNPRKGYRISFTAATGKRIIKKHPLLNDTLYNALDLNTTQYDLTLNAEKFFPVFRRSTIRIAGDGAWLISPSLFTNELHRIGGFRSLRGFDEESIFASAFAIATTEFRYLLERNSYAYLFWNGAYYESNLNDSYLSDTPYGFGAGLSFETKAGIFSLSYALGTQRGNPIELRSGKIHFGIHSFF